MGELHLTFLRHAVQSSEQASDTQLISTALAQPPAAAGLQEESV